MYSRKSGAVSRFYLIAEFRSAFLRQLRDFTQMKRSNFQHVDLQCSRIRKDESTVSSMVDVLESWIDPFAADQDLLCISSATLAPPDITADLLNAQTIGENAYQKFKVERLESDPPTTKFHSPMKKTNLKTFTNLTKKKRIQSSGQTVILKTDRLLFGRMIVIAQSRNLHMKEVFSHALGPLPWALATPEGVPRKTNKAALASALQKAVAPADAPPTGSATVIDGMMLVQKIQKDQGTFGDVAASLHALVLAEGQSSQRIDVVFDRYNAQSIKNIERSQRKERGV